MNSIDNPSTKFIQFLQLIIAKEIERDELKGMIYSAKDSKQNKQLFEAMDVDAKGYISIEDIFAFCKKQGKLIHSFQDLKAIRQHLQLQTKLSFQDWCSKLKPRDQTNAKEGESLIQRKQNLILFISHIIESDKAIDISRREAFLDLQNIKDYFKKNYNSGDFLLKEDLKEFLFDTGLYSRVKFTMLSQYIFKNQKEILWNELFSSNNRENNTKLSIQTAETQVKQTKTTQIKDQKQKNTLDFVNQTLEKEKYAHHQSFDETNNVLQQIENIEKLIKEKKEKYLKKKLIIQKEEENRQNLIRTLIHKKNEQNTTKNSEIQQNTRNIQRKKCDSIGKVSSKNSSAKKYNYNIGEQSSPPLKVDYSMKQLVKKQCLNSKEFEAKQDARRCLAKRDQILKKASSQAKLKIQEIQQKVMSKIASKSKLTLNVDQKMNNPVGIRAASSYYDNFLRNIAKTDSRKNY